jgi:hypothetical protein
VERNLNIDRLRSYANILSNSTFNSIVREGSLKYVNSKIKKYDKEFVLNNSPTYNEYFAYLFNSLSNCYRNEYVYKNLIINKILLGKYSLNTTCALNEFHINKSIADLVLINGTSRVFEIKTELDKSDRLSTQINDYKKVFNEIYIVTHHSLQNKYLNILEEGIGLIVLTDRLSLKTVREATMNSNFDNLVMMKCLRKPEYMNIITSFYGSLPKVTDFKFYSTCKILMQKIPTNVLHDLTIVELKKRVIREKEIFASPIVPKELKHICFCLDFDKTEYSTFNEVLLKKINIIT